MISGLWILLVVFAQFLNAGVSLTDRFIVSSKKVTRPVVYAFYVGMFSIFSLAAFLFSSLKLPFGIVLPSFSNVSLIPDIDVVLISILVAIGFIFGLAFLFTAFMRADATDVVPVVGSVTAVFTLIFSIFILNSGLTKHFAIGFIILVFGTFLVSLFRFHIKTLLFSISAGFLFGLQAVLIKKLFLITHFDNAFFWLNIAITLVAIILILLPDKEGPNYREVTKTKFSSYVIITIKQIVSGIAGFLILKAIDFGDVSIVQALTGLQFVFILILSVSDIFGKELTPHFCGLHCTLRQKVQKIVSVIIIFVGFVILFLR
jgi:drug/metabolite transporter (DMT)-like permease